MSVLLADFVNGANIWMVESRQGAGFALEPCHPLRIFGEIRAQNLDGNVATQAAVDGAKNFAHAA
jgi:hypothetical protein